MRVAALIGMVLVAATLCGCAAKPGKAVKRAGDEIVVCGQLFHTGAPVVLWMDPGGYDAYRVEKRFVPLDKAAWDPASKEGAAASGPGTPNRYGLRFANVEGALTADELERVRGGGWDLDLLRRKVDQFVIHYDACGTSRQCFRVLHDMRGLSVHFMLDVDGTIYQTLDVKERAWHATTSNDRSVGIEIASIGAYPLDKNQILDQWYQEERSFVRGRMRMTLPASMGDGGVRTPNFVARPMGNRAVAGPIQGQMLEQYDFTPEQYQSLTRLAATLCTVLPRIRCDYPRDAGGQLVRDKLPDDELASYQGLLGHYHLQQDKTDPGPAFQWDRVVNGARRLMGR